MKVTLLVASLLLCAMPGYAQGQPDIAKLKADAEKLVKMTSADKQQLQAYCEVADLSDQIGQSNEDEGTEKTDELSRRADEVQKKLDPEFVALAEELSKLDPNSEESREIGTILNKLDELCGD
jgi:type I site-specific restriction endonuclease